ncbi:MAG: AbrB/MazE/SpoVT family DNA-binding domain-containing protein [Candidatus Aenigmarchaeota archaeon]|nr:AbrB/MazE/SpoVT family DNA-binding domain-containing protein [Candidatus Aenigmarchaeota archaeon]
MIKKIEYMTRLGPKSQIVLKKESRELMHLKPGSLVIVRTVKDKTELEPVTKEQMIAEVKKIAKSIGKRWPKGKTSADLVREERR